MSSTFSPLARPSLTAWLFIFLTVLFTVIGQLLVKRGMLAVGAAPGRPALWPAFLWQALTDPRVLWGFACAFAAAVSWIIAVSRSDLSMAYPFMGLAIVLVLVLSSALFGERVSAVRWLGVLLVCAGLWIAAKG